MVKLEMDRYKEFPKFLNKLGCKVGAEIGVSRGLMSKHLCMFIPGVKLYCVDPWLVYPGYNEITSMEENEAKTRERLAGYDVEIIKKTSMEAVRDFEDNSLDFVWIDGNHAFDWAMEDIINWSRKVKPGGIVSGHDYGRKRSYWGVIEAVDIYTKVHKIDEWYLFSTKHSPAYYWVKE
jgi:SAM-dependent methyltransferase